MNACSSLTLADKQTDSRQLLDRLRSGDEKAFAEVIRENRERIYNRANTLLSNRQDAEEVTQDTFIRARNGILKFRGDCSISTWLYHIATNLARNKHWYWWRRKRNSSVSFDTPVCDESSLTLADIIHSDDRTPLEETDTNEFMKLLPKAIENLPTKYSEVIRLRTDLDLSYEEIAEKMNISVGTVKSRLSRAREYLRAELEKLV